MEPADFVEPEIAVTAAITAAICSPRARKVMRKGLVYGMAGILTAGDVVTTFARSVRQGVRQTEGKEETTTPTAQKIDEQEAQAAKGSKTEPETTGTQPRKTMDKKATIGGQSE
ncbi:hypothetical protein [Dictyobacter formicarum]|uniref:DUF1490 domain-containing protein n=1 Tax=Dictyobacter formicarum TaxID=2778368 RepID=A0ABQ3VJG4_9CHLR|nr:hypothetical protein [Dictyobacter formicarum]GHO85806.1 hypothetical protein KSZ_38120 [Dictyobacter formicarum]